jgi:hypothetical protein
MFGSTDMPKELVAGVIAHPSITLEENIFNGNAVDLVARSQRPILLLPAGNDPDRS